MPENLPDLLPCPFCGSSDLAWNAGPSTYAMCNGCGRRTEMLGILRERDK